MEKSKIIALAMHLSTMALQHTMPQDSTMIITNPYQQEKEFLGGNPIDGREARRIRRARERKNKK